MFYGAFLLLTLKPQCLSVKFLFIGEFIISYFYELFNRFGFSLLPPTQFLRGDRLWSPLCVLCRFRLFLELCDFLFLLLYHLGKLRFAFFSCLCVHIEFLSAAVGESWKVASFPQVIVYLIHASGARFADLSRDEALWAHTLRLRVCLCLPWVCLPNFWHLCVRAVDFAVNVHRRLHLHGDGHVAMQICPMITDSFFTTCRLQLPW